MVERISSQGVKVAMVAVPAEHAQGVADKLVEAGIQAILNYAPIILKVPDSVRVQYLDPVMHLQHMTYKRKVNISYYEYKHLADYW